MLLKDRKAFPRSRVYRAKIAKASLSKAKRNSVVQEPIIDCGAFKRGMYV